MTNEKSSASGQYYASDRSAIGAGFQAILKVWYINSNNKTTHNNYLKNKSCAMKSILFWYREVHLQCIAGLLQ